ncbi:MAG: sensor histidine kinase, partial [Phycisphaerae bacterium]
DFPTTVLCDADEIMQVVRNLLTNAVKFSPDRGVIDVDMRPGDAGIVTRVSDQGIGLPDDEFDAVFGRFVQSSRTKSGAGGTGLGLAICRQIISAHGGRIWAENNETGGATFSFELPLRAGDVHGSTRDQAPAAHRPSEAPAAV